MKMLSAKRQAGLQKKQKGFTLIELLIAFAIILVALGIVFIAVPSVQNKRLASAEQSNLSLLKASVSSAMGNVSYAGLNNSVLIAAGQIPDAMRVPGSTDRIVNSWSGAVTLAPLNLGGGVNNGFTITTEGIPQSVCFQLGTNLASTAETLTINGTNLKAFGAPNPTVPAVSAACNVSAANTIVFGNR